MKVSIVEQVPGFAVGLVLALFLVLLTPVKPVQATHAQPSIPTQLDLGGVQWKIDVVDAPDNAPGTIGFTHCDTHHIELLKGYDQPRHTLIHEILHTYVCVPELTGFDVNNAYYNSSNTGAHEGFNRVADVLSDAMQRNPGLADYLAEGK